MEKFEDIKKRIIDAMSEYYGEKYRANIEKCIGSIRECSLTQPSEEDKNGKHINLYFYGETEDKNMITVNEKYDSFIYPECCYYCDLVEEYDVSVPLVKEFIAISNGECNTIEKKLYALVESCVKIFMSQDNCLKEDHIPGRVCFNPSKSEYYLNRGLVKETFGESEYKEPVLFENACTKFDALKITQNILVTNKIDFIFDRDLYYGCVYKLLENERTREEINFARINHDKDIIKDTPGKPLNTIRTIIDHDINDVFSDVKAKNAKIRELIYLVNQINLKFPVGEKEKQELV